MPNSSLAAPTATRARSASASAISVQPARESSDTLSPLKPRTVSRTQSSNAVQTKQTAVKGRARSSSLMTVTEVGGDDPDNVVDRLGTGENENAAWVNAPGAWLIHPVLILVAKVLIDALPTMTQDVSWTIVNLGYMAVSFLMFHHVTGVPFESTMSTAGAYDELTMWEQIDAGAHYTPAKKWLTSVPIGLFLISTHYTKYNYILFALNFAALVFVLFPKLPVLHRLRFHFAVTEDSASTPFTSRPPSPFLLKGSAKMS